MSPSAVPPIYLDHHASTPIAPEVAEAMAATPSGNPASMHWAGHAAREAIEFARGQIAQLIRAEAKAIVFTSGATEAINLGIQGCVKFNRGEHIVTCQTEHPASLECCQNLEKNGVRVTYLPVDHSGRVDPDAVRSAISKHTCLINLMFANNEVGSIHDVTTIGAIAKEHEILFHCDASQAPATEAIDVDAMNIDLLSLSAHKMYGPQGVGALFLRRRRPRVRLEPLTFGGGHELGYRPGTLNVAGIAGMGKACEQALSERSTLHNHLTRLRATLVEQLETHLDGITFNGHPTYHLPGNCNFTIPGIESRDLMPLVMNELAFSSGSACTSALPQPSHVLLAMGISGEAARQTFRIGLGRNNTEAEIKQAVTLIAKSVKSLRA